MEFRELLTTVGDEPLFGTGLLLAGDVDPNDVRRQLSRWTAAGKLYQLRRGLYALAPPYQKTSPHPFLIANRLVRASYVSLQAALAHYSLIPEHVPVVTSVTPARPVEYETPLGQYVFRHVKQDFFYGYHLTEVTNGQSAFVAAPEKALLDLIYLQPGGDDSAYLQELRLQNLERLDTTTLQQMAKRADSPKLMRAATIIKALAEEEKEGYEILPGRPD
jgi:predicted transcriptional regulator of viral defense system